MFKETSLIKQNMSFLFGNADFILIYQGRKDQEFTSYEANMVLFLTFQKYSTRNLDL